MDNLESIRKFLEVEVEGGKEAEQNWEGIN